MIRENQKLLNRLNLLTDGVLLILSMMIAHAVRFLIFTGAAGHIEMVYYIQSVFVVTPLFLLLYSSLGLYDSFRVRPVFREVGLIVRGNLLGTAMLILGFFLLKVVDISRWVLVIFFFVSTLLIVAKRVAIRKMLKHYRKKGYNQKNVLLIGSGTLAGEYLSAVDRNRAFGYSVMGYVADDKTIYSIPHLGGFDQLKEVIDRKMPDEIVAALEMKDYERMNQVILAAESSGTKISVIPFYSKYMPTRPYIDDMDGIPLINIRRIPLDNLLNAFLKRGMDLVGSLLLIVLTSPLMLFAAVGTLLSSPGPVIFRQERVGKDKKTFIMYKFRSMRVNDDQNTAWSRDADPRKTKFGSFLRKFSIDELPQFFNVLKGDMSLVGPRPELPYFVHKFREEIPLYMVKHQVRPGITGWAQVCGFRGDTSIKGRIEHDIYYIENWSLLFDIKILLQTVFKGIINSEKLAR